MLYAGRAAQGIVWRDEGHRSAASWMAQKTGTALGEAVGMFETSEALQDLPETTDALRRGELSGPQVKVIAQGAAGRRGSERELLQRAASGSFTGLKEHAAQLRAGRARPEKKALATWRSATPATSGTGPIPTGPSASTPSSPPTPGRSSSVSSKPRPTPASPWPGRRRSTRVRGRTGPTPWWPL